MGRRKKFYCPDCGETLKPIDYRYGEWVCDNRDCASNKDMGCGAYAEFYGCTQNEINIFGSEGQQAHFLMLNLFDAYKHVKDHPYRTTKADDERISYYNALDKMFDELERAIKRIFNVTLSQYFGKWCWGHQYCSAMRAIRGKYKDLDEYIIVMEAYIATVHMFLETHGQLQFFYIHFGYTKSSRPDRFSYNPMRTYRVEWYSDEQTLEVAPKHLKQRIKVYTGRIAEYSGVKKSEIAQRIVAHYCGELEFMKALDAKYNGEKC